MSKRGRGQMGNEMDEEGKCRGMEARKSRIRKGKRSNERTTKY